MRHVYVPEEMLESTQLSIKSQKKNMDIHFTKKDS
jgi:hypothetical protein